MAIPNHFQQHGPYGLLPPGTHDATLEEIRASILVEGPPKPIPGWDRAHRLWLLDQLAPFVEDLWAAEVQDIFLDGSFVTDKARPTDIDGFYEALFERQKSILPILLARNPIWMPQRVTTPEKQRKTQMWINHKIEIYPAWEPAEEGILYRKFFTFQRVPARGGPKMVPKGIVKVLKSGF